ncbi:MAG: hypothetical protein V4696_03425 [Pseudomonadota bacterium]
MPRYFMHLHNAELLRDHEGRLFADLEQACAAAREAAGELIAEQIGRGDLVNLRETLEIVDEDGRTVATFRFADFFLQDDPNADL